MPKLAAKCFWDCASSFCTAFKCSNSGKQAPGLALVAEPVPGLLEQRDGPTAVVDRFRRHILPALQGVLVARPPGRPEMTTLRPPRFRAFSFCAWTAANRFKHRRRKKQRKRPLAVSAVAAQFRSISEAEEGLDQVLGVGRIVAGAPEVGVKENVTDYVRRNY